MYYILLGAIMFQDEIGAQKQYVMWTKKSTKTLIH